MIADLQNVVRHMFRIAPRTAQSTGRTSVVCSSLLVAMAVLIIAPVPASAQSVPEPPTLCAEANGDCDSPPVATPPPPGGGVGSKKWNPGHYLKTQGNHAQANTEKYLDSVSSQLTKVGNSPEIRGALVSYAWGTIEPSRGTYNWEPIYRHLNYLSDRGKKLILSVVYKCFGNDCTHLAPADLTNEVYVTPRNYPTSIVAVWEERNMDLFIELWQALAAEFDDHPDVEVIMGDESTPSLGGSNPGGYSTKGYATQLKRMYSAQAESFKRTNVIADINFLGGEVSGLIEHAYQEGVGRGLPDIFDSAGSLVFRGECFKSDCGVRDYRRQVPHFGIVSTPTLIGKHDKSTDSPEEVIEYGVANSFTHYAWVSNEGNEDSWGNIIDAIAAPGQDVHTACPTAYDRCE